MSSGSDHDHPPFGFSTRLRVDFADTDAGGIVYFGRYGRYVERAVMDYRRAAGVPLLGPDGHRFVVRAMDIAFHAPLRFDDEVEVFVRTLRIGTTSHVMDGRFERIDPDGALHVADATVVIVGVRSWNDAVPTAMPDDLRGAIERFEASTH